MEIDTGIVLVLVLWCLTRHFQQYFSRIVAVRFIGGGNWSIQRKTPTCSKLPKTFFLNPNDGPTKYQGQHTSANRYCVHLGISQNCTLNLTTS